MAESTYSLSDIAAITGRGEGDGLWGGNGLFILVLFFLVFGMGGGAWGGGFGGANGALTRAEMYDGFNNQSVVRKLDGINTGLCDGFYAQNTTMLNGFNTIGQEIANSRFAAQQCCCETNRNIDAVRYENAKNTCDIVRAIEKDGAETRALINSNTMQALRDKVAEQGQMLQTANFQLSQQAQNATLISTLRPFPQPAYITCSPYTAANGCGCGY
jgi:hypothetical protein